MSERTRRTRLDAFHMETNRLEAFSDGVFAVAITLLVLNLVVPEPGTAKGFSLGAKLLEAIPTYLAYVLSFITILVMWVNHHRIFYFVKRTDQVFLILNGLLLMIITAMPFAASMLARYLPLTSTIHDADRQVAMGVYCGESFMMALLFNLLWRYAAHGNRLLGKDANPRLVRSLSAQYRYGPVVYLVVLLLDLLNAWLSLGLVIALAVFFAIPSHVTNPSE